MDSIQKMNQDQTPEVKKDMSQDYNEKISNLLAEIDILKQRLLCDPSLIINLTERIHALFIKLSQKMDEKEIAKQINYKRKISGIKLFGTDKYIDEYGNLCTKRMIYKREFFLCKNQLEEREMHLNKCMERIGLTNRSKGRRVI